MAAGFNFFHKLLQTRFLDWHSEFHDHCDEMNSETSSFPKKESFLPKMLNAASWEFSEDKEGIMFKQNVHKQQTEGEWGCWHGPKASPLSTGNMATLIVCSQGWESFWGAMFNKNLFRFGPPLG